jgi:hypothetical protein
MTANRITNEEAAAMLAEIMRPAPAPAAEVKKKAAKPQAAAPFRAPERPEVKQSGQDRLDQAIREHSGALLGIALQSGEEWARLKESFTLGDFHSQYAAAIMDVWQRADFPRTSVPIGAILPEHMAVAIELVDHAPERTAWTYHASELRKAQAVKRARYKVLSAWESSEGCDTDAAAAVMADLRDDLVRIEAETGAEGPEIVDAAAYITGSPPVPNGILEGCFEAGDKVGIIASAKMKKTMFTLQMSLSIAAGREFIGWHIPTPRRVLIVQGEIKPAHFWRRVWSMARAMGLKEDDLDGRLQILNTRGSRFTATDLPGLATRYKAEVLVVDPLYKLTEGDENAARDVKPTLALFDRIATATGAAVVWVHHDAKGAAGERDARDRGAGSNILIRDVDQLFTLSPQRDDDQATVIETLTRNHADSGARAVVWRDWRFHFEPSIEAAPETAADRLRKRSARPPVEKHVEQVVCVMRAEGPMPAARFMAKLYEIAGSHARARELRALAVSSGAIEASEHRGRGTYSMTYGTPVQIAALGGKKESE